MLKPQALRPGGRVAVVAPASHCLRDEFEQGIAELRQLGFTPVFDDRVFARQGYVAGETSLRVGAFLDAWKDPTIAAIIAVRGGYGSVHILPSLSRDVVRRTPKAFIGYSDLTSLLTHLSLGCGIVCFHGPMLAGKLGRGQGGYDPDTFIRALTDSKPLGELAPPNLEALNTGEASGPLFGGTLAQIVASLGTPFAFSPPSGHVLFLEDVNERPYRLDRMLTQLRLAGVLDRASAIVFGEFRGCDEPGGEPTARAALADLIRDFAGPVVFGFPSGHSAGPSITLPIGVRVRVIADARPRLVVEEAAVE
jgi:muramoyltetrapeptide carboxypeptidase